MDKKKIAKIIAKAVKGHSDESPAEVGPVLIEILTADMSLNPATIMGTIKKAFKEAGIIQAASISALGEARNWLKENPYDQSAEEWHYGDMVASAAGLQERFNINDDEEKGVQSAIKLVKAQLKVQEMPVPRKAQLGIIAELKAEYYADTDLWPSTVEGLTDYLVENTDVADEAKDADFIKKMKITAGTDFTYSIMLRDGLTLSDINGVASVEEEDEVEDNLTKEELNA